jgi:hypothetical protein
MKNWIIALIAMLLAGMAPVAGAGQLAAVSVIDQATGERLKIWRHQGRNYVAGNPGDRYALEVRNKTGARLLSVVSVDGINVVTGATAATSQAGYVLDAWQSAEIKGWRKSMEEVAAFYFTRLPDSYAARTDRPDNVGVIGVALFQEYVEPPPPPVPEQPIGGAASDSARHAAPSTSAAPSVPSSGANKYERKSEHAADERLGTGHGERLTSATRMTDFRRASSQPSEIITIYYDTHARLVARGIIPRSYGNTPNPAPFPGSFVPDPKY